MQDSFIYLELSPPLQLSQSAFQEGPTNQNIDPSRSRIIRRAVEKMECFWVRLILRKIWSLFSHQTIFLFLLISVATCPSSALGSTKPQLDGKGKEKAGFYRHVRTTPLSTSESRKWPDIFRMIIGCHLYRREKANKHFLTQRRESCLLRPQREENCFTHYVCFLLFPIISNGDTVKDDQIPAFTGMRESCSYCWWKRKIAGLGLTNPLLDTVYRKKIINSPVDWLSGHQQAWLRSCSYESGMLEEGNF